MESIMNFFSDHFYDLVWLATIIVAMIPTLESKIAIPFAMSVSVWGDLALPAWQACIFAFIGSMLPSLFALFCGRKIKKHTTGFLSEKIMTRYSVKTSLLDKQQNNFKKYLLLAGFVAVPLPLTGVWTGSLIAGLSSLKTGYSLLAIMIGALISCIAITLLCTLLENSIGYVLMVSLLIVIAFLVVDLLGIIFKQFRRKRA